jgi:hypothetical protein
VSHTLPAAELAGLSGAAFTVIGMSRKRPNPKKNKAARRRRPDRSGLRRARIQIEAIHHLMQVAPPDALPLVGLTSVWLWNLAEDGQTAAHCVDGCLTLHHALAEYGIGSRVEAIGLSIEGNGSRTLYASRQGPRYNADGSFNGHAVLVVPDAGRFIDPTIQQYPEVPDSERAMLPLQGPLPASDGLGDQSFDVHRGDHVVTYLPVPEHQRQNWRSPAISARTDDYSKAGANLAANVFAMMRLEGLRDKMEQSPYPRLRRLLTALDGAQPVADSHGFRFADPATGTELRLSDVP